MTFLFSHEVIHCVRHTFSSYPCRRLLITFDGFWYVCVSRMDHFLKYTLDHSETIQSDDQMISFVSFIDLLHHWLWSSKLRPFQNSNNLLIGYTINARSFFPFAPEFQFCSELHVDATVTFGASLALQEEDCLTYQQSFTSFFPFSAIFSFWLSIVRQMRWYK